MKSFIQRYPAAFVVLCCAVLTVLWLPGLRYPVVSDTVQYAALGQAMMSTGRYALDGVPYAAHLPFHAFLSVPFVMLFGINLGMHLLTLVGGWATLVLTLLLFRRATSTGIAALATVFLLFHPAFILMSMLGSADLTFTALLLASLYFYLGAKEHPKLYIACGVTLGLLCLTRYNGVPFLLLLFVWTLAMRPRHRLSPWFWSGMVIAAALFSLWLVRNYFVFGNPLYTVYTTELAHESDGPLRQIINNAIYYGNPIRNIFLLLPFALIGIALHARRQMFLFLAMLAAWLLTAVWWVQAMRFAFPGYPLLLGFAALGVRDAFRWVRTRGGVRLTTILIGVLITSGMFVQGGLLCAYTYGPCNAWIDRHSDILPKNIGLTPEGFEAWAQAKDWINENAPEGAAIGIGTQPHWKEHIFRPDLRLVDPGTECPVTEITQHPKPGATIFFTTTDAPATSVTMQPCP